jgi:probable F420-dependent oxidoreductase
VLETDPDKARAIARSFLATYLPLPNYANNWFRFGLTPDDTLDGGTDRLVDALIAWGDEDAIAARIQAHRDAGADHVCIQVLTDDPVALTLDGWRRLAPVLCG